MGMQFQNVNAVESVAGAGLERLLEHYDSRLRTDETDHAPVLAELANAIAALRAKEIIFDGPAFERFARAWTSVSRLNAARAMTRRPAHMSLH